MTDIAFEVLTGIEQAELRLLTWGYVDGGFTRDELVDRIDDALIRLDDKRSDPERLLSTMLAERLVVEVPTSRGVILRSRMAETVRLLSTLRQLFPAHRDGGWQGAATLVSDFRIVARARVFPKQDEAPRAALDELEASGVLRRTTRPAAESLLAARGASFQLSRFQIDATSRILAGVQTGGDDGTIVSAGTGAGKTLAFYLPALAHLAATAERTRRTRLLALYPRIELLRDQLAQALRELRALRSWRDAPRPLTIGALYKNTPWYATGVESEYIRWERAGGGHVCPYTRCPFCGDGDLIWRTSDRDAEVHRLVCSVCSGQIDDLVLTRARLREQPPDVLFTTTEMLNRAMADPGMRGLVGLGGRGVDLVLLDEAHTYGATHGAHVARLLRRWRSAHRGSAHVVGLSATLAESREFLAALTGLSPDRVALVEPRENDVERKGQEYLIALRSDPWSGAGVLSTSIQAAMLLARSLDRQDDPVSGGAFGERVFAFTDDLDVTNRLYFDLLHAEGRAGRNFVLTRQVPLASLRAPTGSDLPGRRDAGQVWDMPSTIGWPLVDDDSGRLRVGRTSSQDAGVDRDAEVIVATASLEVGFDDDRVGAVLQHKSPHDDAAFVQRKGRAGRTRSMRPWTAIVLSDFGRDHQTYLSYERLFDPQLAPRSLPTANPVVLRMQAVYGLLEWLATRHGIPTWSVLAGPGKREDASKRAEIVRTLRQVAIDPAVREAFAAHLQRSLRIDSDVLAQILWDPPRPLLTTVVPTAIRRLDKNWTTADGGTDRVGSGPLPEFVVSRLFSDLELPEVVIETPGGDEEPLRLVQALNAFAPGRVSHRLTIRRRRDRHWIQPPELRANQVAQLEIGPAYRELEELGRFQSSPAGPRIRCVRPGRIVVSAPPDDVRSSSNATMEWESQLIPPSVDAELESIDLDERLPVTDIVTRVVVLTHGQRTPMELRRWVSAISIELEHAGTTTLGRIGLVDDEKPVGIGFALEVDGLGIELAPRPADAAAVFPSELEQTLRTDRFREDVMTAPEFADRLDHFRRAHVVDAYLAALIDAASVGLTAREAHDELASKGLADVIARTLARLPAIESHDDDDEPDHGDRALLGGVVERAASRLWEPIRGDWDRWIADRTRATVGAAVHRALQTLCPEYDFDDVNVDVRRLSQFDDPADRFLWLTESTPGGGGPLQEAARRVAERPWVFSELVINALEPSDAELVDAELRRAVGLSVEDPEVAAGLHGVRQADTHVDRLRAFDTLRALLSSRGVFVCHPVVSAISTRLLRPGSSRATDEYVLGLLMRWDRQEGQLGIEVPLTTFAWGVSSDDGYERSVGITPPPGGEVRRWRAAQVTGLLWPRGGDARRPGLRAPNRFHGLPASDRLLARGLLRRAEPNVSIENLDAATGPDGPLASHGAVNVVAPAEQAHQLRALLLASATKKIEAGAVFVSPAVTAIHRTRDGLTARLSLTELL